MLFGLMNIRQIRTPLDETFYRKLYIYVCGLWNLLTKAPDFTGHVQLSVIRHSQ